jgi:hypothetical protein
MVPEKYRPVLLFFGFVFLTMGSSMIYLLFFNTGIDIVLDLGEKEQHVYIANTSMHLIRDINVSIQKKSEGTTEFLTTIKQLNPKEKVEIEIPNLEKEQIRIIATAPFHATVKRDLSLDKTKGAKLNFEIMTQNTAYVGIVFSSTLKICNEAESISLQVEEVHDQNFFEEKSTDKTIEVKTGECQKINFNFTPKKTGEATIFFRVTAASTSKEFERTIKIVEE